MIAIGAEFLIVVVGVLVALAVDQMVDARAEHRLERDYLSALQADVESDLSRLRDELHPGIDRRAAMAREVIAALDEESPVDAVRLAVALDWAGHLTLFEPRRATFDDLLGTGNLRLIRDRELRADVVEYHDLTALRSMHDLIRREIWFGYRESVDEVLDPLVMAEITRVEREVDRDLDRLIAGLDGAAVAAGLDLTALRSSEAFRAGIGGALEYTLVQRDQYRQRVEMAEELLLRLHDELASR